MNLAGLWHCILAEWKIKLFLGGAITGVFWLCYFLLERLPDASVTKMPELAIDRMIPFQPGASFIYVTQFAIMPLVIWLMSSRHQLFLCCRGLALLVGISFVVFYFWPTSVARPQTAPGNHFLFDLIAGADLPRNACPSLHAAFGVFTVGCAWDLFRDWTNRRWLMAATGLWTVAVLASTLLIKQHVVLDLVAGGFLGMMSWWFAAKMPGLDLAREKHSHASLAGIKFRTSLALDEQERNQSRAGENDLPSL